jgi:hypothetical protein
MRAIFHLINGEMERGISHIFAIALWNDSRIKQNGECRAKELVIDLKVSIVVSSHGTAESISSEYSHRLPATIV